MAKFTCPRCGGSGKIEGHTGMRILAMREKRNMTQAQLAPKVELSRAQIANIEAGRSELTVKSLKLFAAALKCSPMDLIP